MYLCVSLRLGSCVWFVCVCVSLGGCISRFWVSACVEPLLVCVCLGPQVPATCVAQDPPALCAPFGRTATVWRSLSPFWGEEYTVHLPLDFHQLAFYVLDEDTVGCVCWGPRPGRRKGGGTPRSQVPAPQPSLPAPSLHGRGGVPDCTLTPPPFRRHDDVIGKVSLSRDAIAADPRGG